MRENQKYEQLLEELGKYNYDIEDDDRILPTQKEFKKTLNLSRKKLLNLMYELHDDLKIKLHNPSAYKISNSEVWIYAKFREDYWTIGVDGLEKIPRVGDRFRAEFISGEFGGRSFYVDDVSHEFKNGIHTINIFLIGHILKSKEEDFDMDKYMRW